MGQVCALLNQGWCKAISSGINITGKDRLSTGHTVKVRGLERENSEGGKARETEKLRQ